MKPTLPSEEFNPYAAPKADLSSGPFADEQGVWRVGNDLILTRDAEFPDRCIRCNRPAEGLRVKKSLSWHPPAYYLTILISPLLYIIIALIVRKTAKVRFPVCAAHRSRRRRVILVAWLLGLGAFPVMIAGATASSYVSGPASDSLALGGFLLGMLMIIVGLVVGLYGARLASTTKIDKQFVHLSNVGPEFLASLPPYGA